MIDFYIFLFAPSLEWRSVASFYHCKCGYSINIYYLEMLCKTIKIFKNVSLFRHRDISGKTEVSFPLRIYGQFLSCQF